MKIGFQGSLDNLHGYQIWAFMVLNWFSKCQLFNLIFFENQTENWNENWWIAKNHQH
jgi:hypothetical protein